MVSDVCKIAMRLVACLAFVLPTSLMSQTQQQDDAAPLHPGQRLVATYCRTMLFEWRRSALRGESEINIV